MELNYLPRWNKNMKNKGLFCRDGVFISQFNTRNAKNSHGNDCNRNGWWYWYNLDVSLQYVAKTVLAHLYNITTTFQPHAVGIQPHLFACNPSHISCLLSKNNQIKRWSDVTVSVHSFWYYYSYCLEWRRWTLLPPWMTHAITHIFTAGSRSVYFKWGSGLYLAGQHEPHTV